MTTKQADAFAQLRRLAGHPGAPSGNCNGPDCHGCPLPRGPALGVYADRPRLFAKLWAIPGVRRWQTDDREMRAVFPPGALPAVAEVIRARRRRAQSLVQTQNLAKGPRSAGSRR